MNHSIHRLFDDIAPTYDVLNHLFSLNIDHWWRHTAVQAITLPNAARVLDMCTGTADVALAVARRYPDANIYGVDFSQAMLRHGQAKITRHRREDSVTLLRADALALPFLPNTFDAAFLSFGLRNLTDRRAGIHNIYRMLRPDGCLVILELAPPPNTLWGRIFRWYLGHIMPAVGRLVSKSPSAYRYLHHSIEQFPESAVITALLQDVHFRNIRCRRLMGGMLYLYVGRKTGPHNEDVL